MIEGIKPYLEYSNPAVSWLEKIPAHWDIEPGFAAYREKQQKNIGMVENRVLSLSYGRIVIKPADKLHGLVPESFETYQVVDPGDIIIRSTDLQNDWTSLRVGLVRDRGIITSAYLCLKMVGPLVPEYGYLQLHVLDLMKVFYGMGSGLRQNLDFSDFKRMPVLVPPRAEQDAIVRFLDYTNRRIERYIRAKKKLIALLNEQKQVIIHRAVTRGLDLNVRLKPSGIRWLGNIPEHWNIRKLGHIAYVFNGTTPSRMQPLYWMNGSIAWLSSGKVNDYVVREPSELVSLDAVKDCSLTIVPRGSVILGMIGQGKTRGMSAWLAIDACINQNLAAIVPRQGLSGRFLHYLLTGFYRHIREFGRGGNQEALNCEIVASLRLPLPPGSEQSGIVDSLNGELFQADEAITRAEREISLVREYRTRLTADVVTGRLDVRNAVTNLPEEPEAATEPVVESTADEDETSEFDDMADSGTIGQE